MSARDRRPALRPPEDATLAFEIVKEIAASGEPEAARSHTLLRCREPQRLSAVEEAVNSPGPNYRPRFAARSWEVEEYAGATELQGVRAADSRIRRNGRRKRRRTPTENALRCRSEPDAGNPDTSEAGRPRVDSAKLAVRKTQPKARIRAAKRRTSLRLATPQRRRSPGSPKLRRYRPPQTRRRPSRSQDPPACRQPAPCTTPGR